MSDKKDLDEAMKECTCLPKSCNEEGFCIDDGHLFYNCADNYYCADLDINYCPICGKKLDGDKNE